jgi:hypothetical protein
VAAGSGWHHIFLDRFSDPLGFGIGSGRLSGPSEKPTKQFGVFYVGQTFEIAYLETVVRDRRYGNPAMLLPSSAELDAYAHVRVTVEQPLQVIDSRRGNAVRVSSHLFGQRASLAVYQRSETLDRLCYPSRLNGDDNLAIYDRAVPKLAASPKRKLASILDSFSVALVWRGCAVVF